MGTDDGPHTGGNSEAGQVAYAILKAQQEMSPDGILVVDGERRIVSYNQRFLEIWRIPSGMMESESAVKVLRKAMEQTADPGEFLENVTNLYRHIDLQINGEVLLSDGRTIERYSTPMYGADGSYYGRVWYFRDITERSKAESALRDHSSRLQERIKELNCLYGVSRLIEKGKLPLEKVIQGIVDLLPPAFQYPSCACARALVEGREYTTEGFRRTEWSQTSPVSVNDEQVGAVEVCYLEEKPCSDEGPFLKEERALIDSVAGRLGRLMEGKRADEKLQASLKEKEMLLKEIHHRVKNSLTIVADLLTIQGFKIRDPMLQEAIRASQARIHSIALIHEKLYSGGSLAGVDFGSYIESSVSILRLSYGTGGIAVTITSCPLFLEPDRALPLALIVNELVTNAFKYAFPGGREGNVTVDICDAGEGKVVMTIEDDGIGFPEDMDLRNSSSLGMELVDMFVEQIRGTLEASGHKGAKFTVRFDRSPPSANSLQ